MAIGLLGKKLGMTQIYNDQGTVIPVTLILAGPCPVLQKRERDRDGYEAVQLGFDERSEKNVSKPMEGHFQKAGVKPVRFIREMRVEDTGGFEIGQTLQVDIFEVGDRVDVSGVSKGRGFSGTVRRHKTGRGPQTHGSHYHRRPGSSGQSADPSRVYKGKKNPGQYGNARRTTQNLTVVGTDVEKNILLVSSVVR